MTENEERALEGAQSTRPRSSHGLLSERGATCSTLLDAEKEAVEYGVRVIRLALDKGSKESYQDSLINLYVSKVSVEVALTPTKGGIDLETMI